MNKPGLWRYYGLSVLLIVGIVGCGLCQCTAINLDLEAMRKEIDTLAALVIGISFIIRGIDFVLHMRQYPLFLKEHAPAWDSAARSWTPARLLLSGILCVSVGGVITSIGVYDILIGVMPFPR